MRCLVRKDSVGGLVLLAGTLLSPCCLRADEAAAVAAIKKIGGLVYHDNKKPNKPVVMVTLNATKVTDEGLKILAPLKSVQQLYLQSTRVTDAGLKELA